MGSDMNSLKVGVHTKDKESTLNSRKSDGGLGKIKKTHPNLIFLLGTVKLVRKISYFYLSYFLSTALRASSPRASQSLSIKLSLALILDCRGNAAVLSLSSYLL